MTRERDPWHDARRAWDRLREWSEAPTVTRAQSALDALSDLGVARRLLDEIELDAVRAARRAGRSWAEIATRLGVSRQSAWERWRELDDEPAAPAAPDTADDVANAPALSAREAAARRRSSTVRVPNVVGLRWDEARARLQSARLIAVGADPDGPPAGADGWPDTTVVDQSPEAGAKVQMGTMVRLWRNRGGGAGVREPRRPDPSPLAARAMRDEVTDEAV